MASSPDDRQADSVADSSPPRPVVVLLHGHGGDPQQWDDLAMLVRARFAVDVLTPRGPFAVGGGIADDGVSEIDSGWAWWPSGSEDHGDLAAASLLDDLVGVADAGVVLVGFSQGGAMALALAGRALGPVRTEPADRGRRGELVVSGVAVVSGFLPPGLEALPPSNVPLLVVHGEGDDTVDPLHGRLVGRRARAAGWLVTSVDHGDGHEWADAATVALIDWLEELLPTRSPAGG